MRGKEKVPERRSGLRPEKERLEWHYNKYHV
jgi:hypothetical protein